MYTGRMHFSGGVLNSFCLRNFKFYVHFLPIVDCIFFVNEGISQSGGHQIYCIPTMDKKATCTESLLQGGKIQIVIRF